MLGAGLRQLLSPTSRLSKRTTRNPCRHRRSTTSSGQWINCQLSRLFLEQNTISSSFDESFCRSSSIHDFDSAFSNRKDFQENYIPCNQKTDCKRIMVYTGN